MFVTKIWQVLLLAVLNDWCSGADIDSIFSDFFTKNKDPKSILEKQSIFSDLRSDTDQPSSVKELLDSVPKRGNRVTRENPVEDDRPVWGTPGPTKAEELPNFHSTNPTGGQHGRATSSGTTFQPQQAQTTPQSQSNSDKNIVPTYRTIVKVDKEVAEPLYVPNHMKDFVTSPSMIYCLNYCTFPVNYPLAQGGTDAIPHEFPHMVALGFGSGTFQGKSLVSWNSCGGSLISKNFVLTAAHCLDSDRGPPTQVRVGEHDLSKLDVVVPAQDFPILRIIIHPGYNSSFVYHDIALLQLARDVPFTRAWNLPGSKLFKVIWPACLHQGLNVKRYENEREYQNQEVLELPHQAVATGWGNTGFVDAPSDILQKVNLDVIDHQTCKRLLGRDALIPNGVDEKTQVCAGVLAGGRDTCNGDSGGPLQINNKMFYWHRYCPMEIVGITSFGRYCGNADTPSVYTRVSHYVPWIENIVWPTVPETFENRRPSQTQN